MLEQYIWVFECAELASIQIKNTRYYTC